MDLPGRNARIRLALAAAALMGCPARADLDASTDALPMDAATDSAPLDRDVQRIVYDLDSVAVTLDPRVVPGGRLAVVVRARNTGTMPWTTTDVRLTYVPARPDDGVSNTMLPLAADTPPGQTGEFSGRLGFPQRPGRYRVDWQATHGGRPFGVMFGADVEVTCSDGVFCNGEELWIAAACAAGVAPCDDGAACTADRCDEASGTCAHAPGAGCAACGPGCAPRCEGRACGDDGCGSSCGACEASLRCVSASGRCATPAACDGDRPQCSPACGPGSFCGVDCVCRASGAPRPDLSVSAERLRAELSIATVDVAADACALGDGCVGAAGARRVLRFSAEVRNQGNGPVYVPTPAERPELYTSSRCAGDLRFNALLEYQLLDASGRAAVPARRALGCVAETAAFAQGPGVPCDAHHDCLAQGLQAGWATVYAATEPCQSLDITGVAAGEYTLRVRVNPARVFDEASLDNNEAAVRVTIAPP